LHHAACPAGYEGYLLGVGMVRPLAALAGWGSSGFAFSFRGLFDDAACGVASAPDRAVICVTTATAWVAVP